MKTLRNRTPSTITYVQGKKYKTCRDVLLMYGTEYFSPHTKRNPYYCCCSTLVAQTILKSRDQQFRLRNLLHRWGAPFFADDTRPWNVCLLSRNPVYLLFLAAEKCGVPCVGGTSSEDTPGWPTRTRRDIYGLIWCSFTLQVLARVSFHRYI